MFTKKKKKSYFSTSTLLGLNSKINMFLEMINHIGHLNSLRILTSDMKEVFVKTMSLIRGDKCKYRIL